MNDPDSPDYNDTNQGDPRDTPEEKEIALLTMLLKVARKGRTEAESQLAEIRESCSVVRMQDHFNDTPLEAALAQQAMQRDQLTNSKRLYEMTLANEMDWMRKWDEARKLLAHCINQCAAHIGPDTSATIDGLPLAVKRVVDERNEAERLRDDWCSQFVKVRNTLRAIYALAQAYSGGAPDVSRIGVGMMADEVSELVIGALGRDGVSKELEEA